MIERVVVRVTHWRDTRLVAVEQSAGRAMTIAQWRRALPLIVDAGTATQYADRGALPDGHRATDVGNSKRLAHIAGGRLRHVPDWNRWIVYRDGCWIVDDGDHLAVEEAKRVARELFRLVGQEGLDSNDRTNVMKWALRSEQASGIRAMLSLTPGIRGIRTEHTELDQHPYLLNVRNGTIDLQIGQLGPHRPEDLLTKQAPVNYDPDARAPLWTKCLERWQPDPEMREFLQRAVGSAATGHPVERLFVNYGTGSNGKSKFFEAIGDVLGPYVVVPQKSLLVRTRHEDHTAVAALFGARMLTAAETDPGESLNETSIKNLTGGDQLSARRLYENFWHFDPSWTAFLHTNYEPKITGTDEAIWRRVRMIPWGVTIPMAERDEELAVKLRAEAPGILNWIIEGAKAWLDDPNWEPQGVVIATATYRQEQDVIGRFLADECVVDDLLSVFASDLRERYVLWCDEAGLPPETPQALGPMLKAKGLRSDRPGGRSVWHGAGLRDRS